MEIILTRQNITEDEIDEIRTTLTAEDARSDDMIIPEAEAVKVGGAFVRVKVGGLWLNWKRSRLSNIVIDGHLYPLHGEEFLRINCITSQEELTEAKERITESAEEFKRMTKEAYDELIAGADEKLQAELDKLDKEFLLQIG